MNCSIKPLTAPNRRDQMQGLGTIGITFERFFHRLNLTGNAPDAVEQFIFVFMNMRHTYTPYPYTSCMLADYIATGKRQPDERSRPLPILRVCKMDVCV